jgi:predicted DNA-binding transcriptional regulator AlpA
MKAKTSVSEQRTPIEFLTVPELSAHLRKSITAIYAMVARKELPHRRTGQGDRGGKLIFIRSEIDEWVRRQLDEGPLAAGRGLSLQQWEQRNRTKKG